MQPASARPGRVGRVAVSRLDLEELWDRVDPEFLIGSGMKEEVHGDVRNRFVEFDIMLKAAVRSPLRSGGITRGE
jgi:hypothetical protein